MTWQEIEPAPLILIRSAEPVFADRAITNLKTKVRTADPNTEITTIDITAYQPGLLMSLASPSLFGEAKMIVVGNLERTDAAFQRDMLAYIDQPDPSVVVVLRHNGGNGNKKILDTLKKQHTPTVTIAQVKSPIDKAKAVEDEVRGAKRKITNDAVGALVDALGSDLRELLAATDQLMADVSGTIEADNVHTYFAGRIEATGFNVADAVVAGRIGEAIELSRHAVATGTNPVAITSAIAMKLRAMGQVLGQRSGNRGQLRMAPWQIDRAKRDLRGWSANGLADSILAIAETDAAVKGQSRDPQYALERGILNIGRAHKRK